MLDTTVLPPSQWCFPFPSQSFCIFNFWITLVYDDDDNNNNSLVDGWMVGRTDGQIDGWMDGWVDGWMDAWIDGWMDR
jgi:hypothetical protein